jgi:hypothetical protein
LFRVLTQLDILPFMAGALSCEVATLPIPSKLSHVQMSWVWAILVLIYSSLQWLSVGYYFEVLTGNDREFLDSNAA